MKHIGLVGDLPEEEQQSLWAAACPDGNSMPGGAACPEGAAKLGGSSMPRGSGIKKHFT